MSEQLIKKHNYSKKKENRTHLKEKAVKIFFFANGVTAFFFFCLIFLFLLKESVTALSIIDMGELISHSSGNGNILQWYPTSEEPYYSLIPLLLGSLLTSVSAIIISSFFGIIIGIYLSEFAGVRVKEILKPVMELFSSIPTVVIGFFMLVIGATFVQDIFFTDQRLNAFVASLGLSIIIIPTIATLTEEVFRNVPQDIRIAATALGATKWQLFKRIIFPTAKKGISSAIILGFGRAIGETMIVLMVSGNAGNITGNIFKGVRTMTATIAAEMGEVTHNSEHYYVLMLIGMFLFIITFVMNFIAEILLSLYKRKESK